MPVPRNPLIKMKNAFPIPTQAILFAAAAKFQGESPFVGHSTGKIMSKALMRSNPQSWTNSHVPNDVPSTERGGLKS